MTRKDYIAIASALADARPFDPDDDPDMWSQWATDVHALAGVLAADNSRFDKDRFVLACYG